MGPFVVLVTSTAISEQARRLLREAGGEIVFMEGLIDEAALLAAFCRQPVTAAILRGPAPFTPAVFDAATHLRVISKYGAGIDSVDLQSANARGVAVMVTSGANADAVAEHALALMLALARELPRFGSRLRGGLWKDPAYLVRDFRERTVGIVGYGQIGQRTARLAAACGATVVVHSRTRAELPPGMAWEGNLDALLARADILSLHCPLTDRTRGLIGARELALMPPGAIIVNTARGRLIDEQAMIAALQDGRLAGAGLDVFETEPPGAGNPLIAMPSVLCTPHIASFTTGADANMGVIAARNIIGYLRGEPVDPANFINPQVCETR